MRLPNAKAVCGQIARRSRLLKWQRTDREPRKLRLARAPRPWARGLPWREPAVPSGGDAGGSVVFHGCRGGLVESPAGVWPE
jgi:hypothetical protein